MLGTFQYMAPEQVEGKEADARTDIFAFGSVLFEMLTGRRAFHGESRANLIGAILKDEPPPVSHAQPAVPSGSRLSGADVSREGSRGSFPVRPRPAPAVSLDQSCGWDSEFLRAIRSAAKTRGTHDLGWRRCRSRRAHVDRRLVTQAHRAAQTRRAIPVSPP